LTEVYNLKSPGQRLDSYAYWLFTFLKETVA
jgi:hypothetical protein